MANCVFRFSPYTNQLNYINWLNKVESQKGQFWKDQGLLDLIQISRVGPTYNQNMFLVALHILEGSMNTF